MSLDFPYYEALRRRKHPAGVWWRVGDTLYYLGLLATGGGFALAVVGVLKGAFGLGWRWLSMAPAVFFAGVATCFIGLTAKGRAYTLGERDGISAADVYQGKD